MIKAIIFDMDGLLIDSEPIWEEAEIQVFDTVGIKLTREMTKQTMGQRVDRVVEHWYSRYPWKGTTKEEVGLNIVNQVIKLVNQKGVAKPGVAEIIKLFKELGLPMGIASSSYSMIINAVLDRLAIKNVMDVVYSAEHEPYGKPHPGVYITAAKMLNVDVEHCLAFEDSPTGILAAKAARMKCVAVPEDKLKGDRRFAIADLEISTLLDFDRSMLDRWE